MTSLPESRPQCSTARPDLTTGGRSPQPGRPRARHCLAKEKAHTRARDALAAERRRMPWMAVEKAYVFDRPDGQGRACSTCSRAAASSSSIAPSSSRACIGWPDQACRGCSMVADQVAHLAHLNARDTTLAFVSRAPQADIARLKARMGWEMPWYTITDSFDADFGVDEWHGHNVFIRDGEPVFRTYFINSRGDEAMGSVWSYLDMTPLGRQEVWEDSPEGYPQTPPYKWWNWHDNYEPERRARPQMGRGVGRRRGGDAQGEAKARNNEPSLLRRHRHRGEGRAIRAPVVAPAEWALPSPLRPPSPPWRRRAGSVATRPR